jgi:hypothetical protein
MNRWRKSLVFAGLVLAVVAGQSWLYPTYRITQKLTVEIATPRGVLTGSSVSIVDWTDNRAFTLGSDWHITAKGEAVLLELADGRFIFAINSNGDKAQGVEYLKYLVPHRLNTGDSPAAQLRKMPPGTIFELSRENWPTLVIFSDIGDVTTARVISAAGSTTRCRADRLPACVPEALPEHLDEVAAALGPGHVFHRAALEIQPSGYWPFNMVPLSWPEWLFGAQLTRQLDARIPIVIQKLEAETKSLDFEGPSIPYRAKLGQFQRGMR